MDRFIYLSMATFLELLKKKVFLAISIVITLLVLYFVNLMLSSKQLEATRLLPDAKEAMYNFAAYAFIIAQAVGVIIALVLFSVIIPSERKARTHLPILAKPISRGTFILAKFTGAQLMLLCFWLLVSFITSLFLVHVEGKVPQAFKQAFILGYLKILLISSIAYLFSVFLPAIISGLFAYLCYKGYQVILFFLSNDEGGFIVSLGRIISQGLIYLFPSFNLLDMNQNLPVGHSIIASQFWLIAAHGLLLSFVYLSGAVYIFSKKDLI